MAKIVLVEDSTDTRDLIKAILEMSGHEVETAETGKEALDKVKKNRPDVILMDVSLPGKMTGLDVTRTLRADAAFDKTVIIALTAHAMVEDRERSLNAGCDEHITKPIADLQKFAAKVSEFAERGRAENIDSRSL